VRTEQCQRSVDESLESDGEQFGFKGVSKKGAVGSKEQKDANREGRKFWSDREGKGAG